MSICELVDLKAVHLDEVHDGVGNQDEDLAGHVVHTTEDSEVRTLGTQCHHPLSRQDLGKVDIFIVTLTFRGLFTLYQHLMFEIFYRAEG